MTPPSHFDVLLIGSRPSGQKAAIAAAKVGHRAAVVERSETVGGVWLRTGTIPSKTMRESIVHLTGLSQRELYGRSYRVKDEITVQDLMARTPHMVSREEDVVRDQLARNHVALVSGTARFVDPHTIAVSRSEVCLTADKIVIATGTLPARPPTVDFDERVIIDSDDVIHLETIPSSMVVVGAGVIGIEYPSMFAALGTKVTVVERRVRMLEFCDTEMVEALGYHLRDLSTVFRFGETVASVVVLGGVPDQGARGGCQGRRRSRRAQRPQRRRGGGQGAPAPRGQRGGPPRASPGSEGARRALT